MLTQRLLWGGTTITSAVMVYLTFAAVEDQLARWAFGITFALLFIASMLMFPYGQNPDGSAKRLINVRSRGRHNVNIASAGGSTHTGPIVSAAKGATVFIMTADQARKISNGTGQAELLPETRLITPPDAKAAVEGTLNRRFGELTDTLLELINDRDTRLFARFADPRFLGPLGTAHRAYAELGSENLLTTLSKLLTNLAAQPVGSRREIFLRQAIDVTRILTIDHINALAVHLYLSYTLGAPHDPDALILALDNLLSPYYGRIPLHRLDYQYMSSAGVCQDGQLSSSFPTKPSQRLYENYRNSMYPAFTYADIRDNLLNGEDDPDLEEKFGMLWIFTEGEGDVRATDDGVRFSKDDSRFRVAPKRVKTILAPSSAGERQLTGPENVLRELVQARTLSLSEFESRIKVLKPDLAAFLDTIGKVGLLHYPLQPVGYVLGQHEIAKRSPQLAEVIDAAFDDPANPATG